jgi:aryl-alcohol dehydrogenase-like predicted oxidoreductase
VLALGTTVYRAAGDDVSTELLDAWVELGGNVLDCGREYGESERVLGEWLERSGRRDDVVLLTKGGHQDSRGPRVTPADVSADLFESLRVLGVESIDLYLLHRDDPGQPVGPIVESLDEHRRAGRIGAYGASNWSVERLEEANAYAHAHGLGPFSCSSPGLSLARQHEPPWPGCVAADDPRSHAWYARTGLSLFPWSSQAGGFFAGVAGPDVVRVYGSEENIERFRRATELGERLGHSANAVALAWVLAQPFPTYPIIGPRTVEELLASLAALELELTPEELGWLNLESELVGDRARAESAAR